MEKRQEIVDAMNLIGIVLADQKSEYLVKWNALQSAVEVDLLEKAGMASAAQSLISTVRGSVADASPQFNSALDQLQSLFSVAVDHAPVAQDSAASQSSAAGTGTSVTDSGPTEQANKTATDPSYPKGSPDGSGSTPGKSTPSMMESDTKPATKGGTTVVVTKPSSSTSSSDMDETGAAGSTFERAEEGKQEEKPEGDNKMEKVEQQPLATNPPVGIDSGGTSTVESHLPEFMAALEAGSLRGAQAVVRKINGGMMDQIIFDEMFSKATKWLLDKGGWNKDNFHKINMNGARILDPGQDDGNLKKAIAMGDMPNYYLIRLVKLMLPLYAGLRRRIPANPPPVGSNLANWRAQLGYGNIDFSAALSTAETQTGGSVPNSFLNFSAPFQRIAFNNLATLESVYTARGYDDPLQVAVISTLTALLKGEELKILMDNSGSLAAPTGVTAGSAATGGTLSAGSYIAYVTALTGRGYLKMQFAGFAGSYNYSSGSGIAPYGVGESTAGSGAQQVTTGATSVVTLVWTPVKGAVGYNLYLSRNGTVGYAATVGAINKYTFTTIPTTGSYPATDSTTNGNGFEGLVSWCTLPSVYGQTIPSRTFIDQNGSGLTTYPGGISEFDTLLASLWTNWQIAPTLIVTSANGAKHITKQVLSTSNVSGYRIEIAQERGSVAGGAFVTGYTNKFAPWADGTPRVIDVMAHPYLPDGQVLFLAETVTYPMAREARGLALETLIPYTYFPLAQTLIQYPFSMLCSEVLECFNPGAFAAVVDVDFTA